MKPKYDCKIVLNGKVTRNYMHTAKTLAAAFKYGAYFYKNLFYDYDKRDYVPADGFVITYEDEVDELATIVFKSDKNYYYNTSEVGKLIKKYLPQLKDVNPNQTEIFADMA